MYLRSLLYALAPQHLMLCARQVVSYVLSILASYAVCQTDLPSCLFNKELRRRLPAWQHLGVEKQAPRNPQARCLAKNHESRRVKDMLRIGDRLKGKYRGGIHTLVYSCHCKDCTKDRDDGCENPQRCALEARKRLDKITPKLNSLRPPNQDNLSLTRRRRK